MNYTIIFVFLLSLMFLTMIFGERLSLFGVIDGRWWTAPFDLVSYLWGLVCEAADRLWCFVFDHFWWVTATVTGSIGIVLIAIMMVGGLSSEARAVRVDSESIMNAGSVLDEVKEIETREEFAPQLDDRESLVSHVMWQFPSEDRFFVPSIVRQPIVETPVYEPPAPRYITDSDKPPAPDYSRDQLKITLESFVERIGRPVRSRRMDDMIQQTMGALRDEWRTVSERELRDRYLNQGVPMRENSEFELNDLLNQVRVLPGEFVSENNLQVEKEVPPGPLSGEFDIVIRVQNRGLDPVTGVVVRELLPEAWSPVEAIPNAVYREATVTWLLPTLSSMDEVELRVRVASNQLGAFQSFTEVSAISAVSTPAEVQPERRLLPRVEPEPEPEIPRREERPVTPRAESRPLPPVGYPKLRLTFDERPKRSSVGERAEVRFLIENIGTEVAEGVKLSIDVPLALDHEDLDPTRIDRTLHSWVRRLEPGQSRAKVLAVTPDREGRHFPTATLILNGVTLDTREFEIVAEEVRLRDDPILPQPDRISQ